MTWDCQTCGACCAYDAEWPELTTARDRGPDGPPEGFRSDDGDFVRWQGARCAALEGTLGECVSCTIYARRPEPCRACEPGSLPCKAARAAHGLPVPVEPSPLDDLLQRSTAGRVRRRRA